MSWVQENKFLTGLLAVTVIGAGFLGYKVISASGAAADADQRFTSKAQEYNRLRRLVPFPNREHLAAFEAQKAEASEAITAFQGDLAKREFPVQPMTPTEFSDKLKATVTAMRGKMQDAGVKFPDKFYFGFEKYENTTPVVEASALLGRQLKAIEWTLDQFVTAHVSELKDLKRTELPEEKGKPASSAPKPSGEGERRAKPQLVSPYPFDIVVVGRQDRVAAALNEVVGVKAPQFFIPRTVKFKNTVDKAPSRTPDAPPAGSVDPNAPAAPAKLTEYIVGREEVEMSVRLEMIDFADVAPKKP